MSDLFEKKPHAPLAELMRPRTLDEVVGQTDLLGPGKPLRLKSGQRILMNHVADIVLNRQFE